MRTPLDGACHALANHSVVDPVAFPNLGSFDPRLLKENRSAVQDQACRLRAHTIGGPCTSKPLARNSGATQGCCAAAGSRVS